MTEQQATSPFVHPGLASDVISEIDLLKVLNIELATLSELRLEKNFPTIRLNRNNRAYLVSDVVTWLKEHRDRL